MWDGTNWSRRAVELARRARAVGLYLDRGWPRGWALAVPDSTELGWRSDRHSNLDSVDRYLTSEEEENARSDAAHSVIAAAKGES